MKLKKILLMAAGLGIILNASAQKIKHITLPKPAL